jgi:hypothetical protein
MTTKQGDKLKNHYESYNHVIKPLIAAYEAREHIFPTPIFNEIRAFNDHISRCYLDGADEAFVDKQLTRAGRHITRLILDLYKYMITSFHKGRESFEIKTKNVDLSIINNGDFLNNFTTLKTKSINALREAKRIEAITTSTQEEIFTHFEIAFNLYQENEALIESNFKQINWAKNKTLFKKAKPYLVCLLIAIATWLIRDLLNFNFI